MSVITASTRETVLIVPRSTEIMSAFSRAVSWTSFRRLAAKHFVAMDAGLILPPESLYGKCEGVTWADHVWRALLTHGSLLTGSNVIQEGIRWALAIRFVGATLSR